MTLAQGGTLPSVLQSPVEAPTWPSSSPLEEEEIKGATEGRGKTEEGDKERPREKAILFGGQGSERRWRRLRERRAVGRR